MPTKMDLLQRQALPLRAKVLMSQNRIREWYNHWNGNVCISFSGGKDSTVLAHVVHEVYPDVPLVFSNTGLEYPEIQAFARKMGAEFVRPKMSFSEVISKYGYPIISKETAEAIRVARYIRKNPEAQPRKGARISWTEGKREELQGERTVGAYLKEEEVDKSDWKDWRRKALMGEGQFSKEAKSLYNKEKYLPLCRDTQFKISNKCCNVMKKDPLHNYQVKTGLKPFLGTLAEEIRLRTQKWMQNGCNIFEGTRASSAPLSFWREQDILEYIVENGLEIASVYGDIVGVDKDGMEYAPMPGMDCTLKCTGCDRTGCIFCGFGAHLKGGRERFTRMAKTHPRQYEYCMQGGQWVDNPDYDPAAPKMDGKWENWNPKKIWVPSKEGLGMKKVFDDVNAIYGKDFIKYE